MQSDAGVGARIRELRERAGVQSQELAARLGIDPSAMSNIERGKRAVKTEELEAISAALGVSPLAILNQNSLLARLPVAPRLQGEGPPDDTAFSRLTALAELHEILTEHGLPAAPHLDDVPKVDTVRWLESAEQLAEWAVERIAPDAPLVDRFSGLADRIETILGIDVLVEAAPEGLAGASITDWSFPFILINRMQPATRATFTLAHELGHVLARQGSIVTLDIDLVARSNTERVANAFAATLLMPKSRVRAVVDEHGRTGSALAAMVAEFGVSFESLVYRLHNLGLINAEGRNQLRARGWTGVLAELDDNQKRRTLLDSMGTRPEHRPPGLLTMRALRGYLDGVLSVRPLAGLLGVDPDRLLDQLVRQQDSEDVINGQYAVAEPAANEELYSGSPV